MYTHVLPFIIATISPDTPEEEEEGNDWLYTVMADIVNTHNIFIEGLYTMVRSKSLPVGHLLPSGPSKIPLSEFTQNSCIMRRTWYVGGGLDTSYLLVRQLSGGCYVCLVYVWNCLPY